MLRALLPLAVLATLAACQRPPRLEAQPSTTAITNVTLIDGTGAAAREGMTVIIRDRRIAAITAAAEAPPTDARIIDGAGKYLLPGLIDAHVHLGTIESRTERITELMLGNTLMGGVTTVRDMGSRTAIVRPLAARATADSQPWPRVFYSLLLAGPGSWFEGARGTYMAEDGPVVAAPLVRLVTDTTDVVAAIAAGRAAGATGIKLYNTIPQARLDAIVRAAARERMPVWGHLAVDPVAPSALVRAGVRVVTHADQFIREVVPYPAPGTPTASARETRLAGFMAHDRQSPALRDLFALMAAQGTLLDPTLGIMMPTPDSTGRVSARDGALFRFALDMVRGAHAAGVGIVAGTDDMARQAPNIHHELQLLVDSVGLAPMEAILAATSNAARAIGVDSIGTVAVGRLADLVLLSADPLRDIANTQTVVGVMKGGHWYPRTAPMPTPQQARPPAG